AEFRSGQNRRAAYSLSRLFFAPGADQKSAFLEFKWSTRNCDPDSLDNMLQLAKNNQEKANIYALFALYGTNYKLALIKKLHQLEPEHHLLPLLLSREVSKL